MENLFLSKIHRTAKLPKLILVTLSSTDLLSQPIKALPCLFIGTCLHVWSKGRNSNKFRFLCALHDKPSLYKVIEVICIHVCGIGNCVNLYCCFCFKDVYVGVVLTERLYGYFVSLIKDPYVQHQKLTYTCLECHPEYQSTSQHSGLGLPVLATELWKELMPPQIWKFAAPGGARTADPIMSVMSPVL